MKNIMRRTLGLLLLVSAVAAEGNSNIANVAVTDNMAGQVMTNAVFAQASNIDANLDGNLINADQTSNINAVDNILTGLKPDDEALFVQSVDQLISDKGNSNVDTQNVGTFGTTIISGINVGDIGSFDSGLIAVGNTMTDSIASQIISQNDTDMGNTNAVTQIANSIMAADILTKAGALQKISEDVHSLGNANTISQNEALTSSANTVTSGNIIQQADVDTSV